jgi:hypothetical protein
MTAESAVESTDIRIRGPIRLPEIIEADFGSQGRITIARNIRTKGEVRETSCGRCSVANEPCEYLDPAEGGHYSCLRCIRLHHSIRMCGLNPDKGQKNNRSESKPKSKPNPNAKVEPTVAETIAKYEAKLDLLLELVDQADKKVYHLFRRLEAHKIGPITQTLCDLRKFVFEPLNELHVELDAEVPKHRFPTIPRSKSSKSTKTDFEGIEVQTEDVEMPST